MSKFPSIEKGTYRHNKTGNLYEVIGVALEVESTQPLVIYRPLYDNEYETFARPYALFTSSVVVDGKQIPRFEKIANLEQGDE